MQDEGRDVDLCMRYLLQKADDLYVRNQSLLDARLGKGAHGFSEDGGSEIAIYPTMRVKATATTWEDLVAEARRECPGSSPLESILTEDERLDIQSRLDQYEKDFNELHRLTKSDVAIAVSAGLLSGLVDKFGVGIPKRTPDGLRVGPIANWVRDGIARRLPADEMRRLANRKEVKVPYDAQNNRNAEVFVEGLWPTMHRLYSLGHDPVLGFVFGVHDIMTGTMTTIGKDGAFVSQTVAGCEDRVATNVFQAIWRQYLHLKSDMTTSMGLPVPGMGLFNLIQFGSIGEDEQTVAEIVQGMYYEGYDFTHFLAMKVPVAITEVLVRIGWAIQRISEGHELLDSIPFSTTGHAKHPKLAIMLLIAHAVSTLVSTGDAVLKKNPLAFNYAEALAFAKYAIQQVGWVSLEKSTARNIYVSERAGKCLEETIRAVAR